MGDDSCLRGHGFKSRCCTLDGHDIFHFNFMHKLYCLFGNTENKQKEAGVDPFLKNYQNATWSISWQDRLRILFSYGYRLGPDMDKRINKDYLKRIKVFFTLSVGTFMKVVGHYLLDPFPIWQNVWRLFSLSLLEIRLPILNPHSWSVLLTEALWLDQVECRGLV